MLRESEGEEASAAAGEEVFGLEVSEGNLLLYSVLNFSTADLAGENAEVLREGEGEDTSATTEDEVFGLEVSERNLLLYSV
ncbi:uncharacterized protein G2W53_015137 [Senna tora]|uniref:Uncharacterized protein n=1 Tax=Senna tora TaxID=362788 RepID=A0A834WV17_9FABA|nr:uncharacterized protein G2W53_015137 [Senna tora]